MMRLPRMLWLVVFITVIIISEAKEGNEKEPGKVYANQYNTTSIAYNVFDLNTSSPVTNRYINGELI